MGKVLDHSKALVMFSGGQDSTVCLASALGKYSEVYTMGFDYGQRHQSELVCRKRILELLPQFPQWAGKLGFDLVVDLRFLATLINSSLTSVKQIGSDETGLPNTFVPGRNLLFLNVAAAFAYQHSIGVIIGGMGEADYSGYPDCREHTIEAANEALNLGMDTKFDIQCPLMHKDKESTWRFAYELGGKPFLDLVRYETHTCYVDVRIARNDWGYGCGGCPACMLRKIGYSKYVASQKV